MTAAIALPSLVSFIAHCSCQFLFFLIQKLTQRFLNAFSYQLLQFCRILYTVIRMVFNRRKTTKETHWTIIRPSKMIF